MNISNITYINLPSNKDRLDNILSILDDCPYPYFKTDGIVVESSYQYSNMLDDYILSKDEKFRCGTIGCFLAHKQAIRNLINKNDNQESYSMILEDDISIENNFWQTLKDLDQQKYESADIIFIDGIEKTSGFSQKVYNLIDSSYPVCYQVLKPTFKNKCYCYGTHCYLIKNQKLSKILQLLDSHNSLYAIDMLMMNIFTTYRLCADIIQQNQKQYISNIR